MKLKILHISDLHYKKGLKNNKVINAFFNDISSINVDFVFFTGDMTFSGSKEDFILFTNEFYSRLVKVIPKERIIFCPGNHDVDRSLIKKIVGKPIVDQINSSDELSQVITGHKTHWYYTTNRLKNYFNFLGIISSDYKKIKKYSYTDFYTNYIFSIEGKDIGITSFNSSWLAEGGQKDYGKLAIGELNVDAASEVIKNCHLKLCLFHHPREWLSPHDNSIAKIKKKYDFAFNGHNHEANPEIYSTPHNNLVFSNTGCLYESDSFFNGYTLLEITDKTLEFNVRTYFPKREEYDKALNLFKGGTWSSKRENLPIADQEKIHFSIFQEQALCSLITIKDDKRNFKERFVFPRLSTESFVEKRELNNKSDSNHISKETLLNRTNRLFIHGKQESGKTCLLYYVGWEIYTGENKMPFYLNLNNLVEKGSDPFFREIRNIANDSEIKNIEDRLNQGKCIILLDNFNEKELVKLDKFKLFVKKYPKNKFVLTISQAKLDSFETTKDKEVIEGFESIYINSFEANNIRDLIKISKPDVQKDEANVLVENICSLLSRTGLPYNPTMISILLDIQSQIGHFVPINKASLLDKLVEILLKKHDIYNVSRGSFDFENQMDLLANFANLLYLKDSQITIVKFEAFVNDYLQQLGIEDITSYSLLESFIKSNILIKNAGTIEFKIKAFQHFFFAKYLHLYPEDIEAMKIDFNYLKVSEAIDFLTGLERKNKELLEFVLSELKIMYNEIDFEYDISKFDDLKISNGLLTELMDDKIISEIKEKEMPESKKDELTQMRYPESQNNSNNIDLLDPKDRFIECLGLSCNIIRNCELIKDIEFREQAIVQVINNWATLLVEIILSINNDEKLLNDLGDDKDKEDFKQFINVIIPIAFQNEILETIGTAKLKSVLRNVLEKYSLSKIERLLLILILEEIDETTNFKTLKSFLNDNEKSYYLREIIFTYLMFLHEIKPMSTSKRNKCINIMSEIVAKKEGGGHKQAEEYAKKEFINRLKKK